MKIYIIDVLGLDSSLSHSQLNRTSRLFAALLQTNPMKGLASRTIPTNLSQDLCATRPRMLILCHHKHPGAFADDKSITICREWPRSALRFMVPRIGQNLHQNEPLNYP